MSFTYDSALRSSAPLNDFLVDFERRPEDMNLDAPLSPLFANSDFSFDGFSFEGQPGVGDLSSFVEGNLWAEQDQPTL